MASLADHGSTLRFLPCALFLGWTPQLDPGGVLWEEKLLQQPEHLAWIQGFEHASAGSCCQLAHFGAI